MLSQGELVCILTYYCLKTQICICNIKCFTQIWQELVKVGHLTTLPLRYNKHYVTNNFLSQCLTVHYRTRELCRLILQEHSKARPHIKTTFPQKFHIYNSSFIGTCCTVQLHNFETRFSPDSISSHEESAEHSHDGSPAER